MLNEKRKVPEHHTHTVYHFLLLLFSRLVVPGESQGRGSLVGCRLWGHTELDTTEAA